MSLRSHFGLSGSSMNDEDLFRGVLGLSSDEDECRGVIGLDSDDDADAAIEALPDSRTPGPKRGRGWNHTSSAEFLEHADLPRSTTKVLRRKLERECRASADKHDGYTCLQKAWDRERLLAGDTVTPGEQGARHVNAWNPEPVVRLAFECVGSGASVSTRAESHNTAVMADCVAWVAEEKQAGMVNELCRYPPSRWLYVERAFDATPVEVELGAMEDDLFKIARYKYLGDDGTWLLLPYEEAKQLQLRCKRGTLQLFAQTLRVAWTEDGALTDVRCPPGVQVRRTEKILLRPVFLEAGTASNEFSAVDEAIRALSLEHLIGLCDKCKYVCLVVVGDSASSNIRVKMYMCSKAAAHNATTTSGKLIFVEIPCNGHILMGMIVKTFSLNQLIPRCYSLNFTFRFPGRYNRLVCLLRNKIEKDLMLGGYVAYPEPQDKHEEWKYRTSAVVGLTLLRPCRTRGRFMQGMDTTARAEDMLRSIGCVMTDLLNADTGPSVVGHLCKGCCKGARECAHKITDCLVAGFVELLAGKAPSTGKYYTLEEVKTAACGFALLHQLGPRLIPSAVGHVEDNDGNVEGDDIAAFRAQCNKHARKAKDAAPSAEFQFDVLVSTWAGEPIETLSNQMQHGEAVGQVWLDLTHKSGLLYQAEHELFARCMSSPDTAFGLDTVIDLLDPDMCDMIECERLAFAAGLDLAAQLESRVIYMVRQSPFDMLPMCDPRTGAEAAEALRDRIMHKPRCCCDPLFGREVIDDARDSPAVFDEIVDGLLAAIVKLTPATNFGLERLLSLIRAACHAGAGRRPRAERMLTMGLLTQLMQSHVSAGLDDARGRARRHDLISQGVRLNAAAPSHDPFGTRRWHIRYANVKVQEERDRNKNLSAAAVARIRTQAVVDYMRLPVQQKREFQATHARVEGTGSDSDTDVVTGTGVALEQRTAWQQRLGTSRWPVNPDLLKPALLAATGVQGAAVKGGHGEGVCNRFHSHIQDAFRKRGLVLDKDIIPDEEIVVPCACFQVHPGLCVTTDHAVYDPSLDIARRIEQHFTKDMRGAFHVFHACTPDGALVWTPYVFFHIAGGEAEWCQPHTCSQVQCSVRGKWCCERGTTRLGRLFG